MATKTAKQFDCVEMKRQAQARIYEEIKDMTSEQRIEYWRRGAEEGPMADWWKKLRKAEVQSRRTD